MAATVPLLYVLSLPWISMIDHHHQIFTGHLVRLRACYLPWRWLSRNTPLKGPLTNYMSLCDRLAGEKPPALHNALLDPALIGK